MFGNGHDGVFLTFGDAGFDFSDQIVTRVFHFRHHDELTPAGNRRSQSQIAAVTPHHFNNRNTLVGRRGIAQAVNGFHYGAQRGKETDSVVSAFDIVIDGAWQADAREAHFSQTHRPHVRTITADNDQRIQATLFHVLERNGTNMFFAELGEAC